MYPAAHNPEVAGSYCPVPATTKTRSEKTGSFLVSKRGKNANDFYIIRRCCV